MGAGRIQLGFPRGGGCLISRKREMIEERVLTRLFLFLGALKIGGLQQPAQRTERAEENNYMRPTPEQVTAR